MSWQDEHRAWEAQLPQPIRDAHGRASQHRSEILRSAMCGCFYCGSIYGAQEVSEWIDEDAEGVGQTALCPRCGIDSAIGDASGFPITPEFLGEMHRHWFEATVKLAD